MMDVKMVVLDLDWTILREDKTISGRSLEVLEECRRRGIVIGVATARSRFHAQIFTDFFTPDVLIYDGGTVAIRGEEMIYNRQMEKDFASAVVRALGEAEFSAQGDGGYFYTHKEMTVYAKERAAAGFRVERYAHEIGFDVPVYKITAVASVDLAKEVVGKFPELGYVRYTGDPYVRIALKDATKWGAVSAVAAHLGIDIVHIAAIGDDWNDLEMIEKCGIGVAMGNAIDEVKAVADYITASNDEDGVALWLEENVL